MKKRIIFTITICLFLALVLIIILWRLQSDKQRLEIKTPFSRRDKVHELTETLEKSGINLETAPLVLGDTIQASISGLRVLFSADENIETQIKALQLVLSRLKMDAATLNEIDLRFKKVIIR